MKSARYTAKLYLGNEEVFEKAGDNADDLYEWMLVEVQGKLGDWHGEVLENNTQEVLKKFRKSPPD